MLYITYHSYLSLVGVVCICLLSSIIFFFKQKTAYEMRISDWSSDVCSSDLQAVADIRERARHDHAHRVIEVGALHLLFDRDRLDVLRIRGSRGGVAQALCPGLAAVAPRRAPAAAARPHVGIVGELGRASCRERVCQYG